MLNDVGEFQGTNMKTLSCHIIACFGMFYTQHRPINNPAQSSKPKSDSFFDQEKIIKAGPV